MPEVLALARRGVKLEKYYTNSICAPSRSAIITGRYPMRLGSQHSCYSMGQGTALPESEETIADAFRRVGYATWAFGKWHLGNDRRTQIPTGRGFDYHYGFYCATVHAFDHTTSFSNRVIHDWHRLEDDASGPGVDGVHADLLIAADYVHKLAAKAGDAPVFTYFAPHLVHESKGASDARSRRPLP